MNNDSILSNNGTPQLALPLKIKPGIKISGKLHRATTLRPRDGKNCGCSLCTGICEVKVEGSVGIEYDPIFFSPDFPNNKAKIYVLADVHFEDSDFGVDENILLPQETWGDLGQDSVEILTSEYTYTTLNDTFIHQITGDTLYSYFEVEVDIDYQ